MLSELRTHVGHMRLSPAREAGEGRFTPKIESGPLVAAAFVFGVPVAVWLTLIFASDGVKLGGITFAVLVFGAFLTGFFYEVRRLTEIP